MAHEQDIHPFAVPTDAQQGFDMNEYQGILNELNQQVRQKQPQDLLQFCSSFFLKKLELERSHHRNAGTNMFSMNSPFGNHGKGRQCIEMMARTELTDFLCR
jgi:cAMP-dependent protein kinase regulator